jgi:hypothetical protein
LTHHRDLADIPVIGKKSIGIEGRVHHHVGTRQFFGRFSDNFNISPEERLNNLTTSGEFNRLTVDSMIKEIKFGYQELIRHAGNQGRRRYFLNHIEGLVESWFDFPPKVAKSAPHAQVFLAFYHQLGWFEKRNILDHLDERRGALLFKILELAYRHDLSQEQFDQEFLKIHDQIHFASET